MDDSAPTGSTCSVLDQPALLAAEEPSSEPTAKNYSLHEELARNRGILRWSCGEFKTIGYRGEPWRRNGGESVRRSLVRPNPSLLVAISFFSTNLSISICACPFMVADVHPNP
jgi:hypothetical protein